MTTPRDRVVQALEHRSTEGVPLDLGGHRSSGISAIAYARLRRHLALPPKPIRVYDVIQQLAVLDEDVLDLFGVDTIELGRAFAIDDDAWADWVLPDGTPCQVPVWARPERHDDGWAVKSTTGRILGIMPAGALYFEQCHYPLADREDWPPFDHAFDDCIWTAVKSPPGPLASGDEGLQRLEDGAKALRARTSRAIIGLFGGNLLEMGQIFFRNDNFFLMLAGAPDRAHAFLNHLTQIHLANLERFLKAVGPHIDLVLFGDDLGSQRGPQISPAMYREFFKPHHAAMWRRAKEIAPVKVMLHCCGGVRELLPDLIDAGLDTINPVQISCRGMDPAELKAEFGRNLTFWGGGCDTQSALLRGTAAEVKDHVRRLLDIWAPGGSYVFQQVHNVLADVPPQNIVAMLEAVRSY